MSMMTPEEHNEMKHNLKSAAFDLTLSGVNPDELQGRIDSLRKTVESIASLRPFDAPAISRLYPPGESEYTGLDSRQASSKAFWLVSCASHTGQTKELFEHLKLLMPLIERHS
ncbi:hypothetical protein [Pantoea vagans]|uniref:hypothetical protein n=1 Tax=Pantoea vagans TaxID=470934 RepID=UPI00366C7DBC